MSTRNSNNINYQVNTRVNNYIGMRITTKNSTPTNHIKLNLNGV